MVTVYTLNRYTYRCNLEFRTFRALGLSSFGHARSRNARPRGCPLAGPPARFKHGRARFVRDLLIHILIKQPELARRIVSTHVHPFGAKAGCVWEGRVGQSGRDGIATRSSAEGGPPGGDTDWNGRCSPAHGLRMQCWGTMQAVST